MSRTRRTVGGILTGVGTTTGVAMVFVLTLAGLLLLREASAADREQDIRLLRSLLTVALVAGPVLGALAGWAARFPTKGIALPWSITLVFGFSAVARLMTAPRPKQAGSEVNSYIASLMAAILGAVVVLVLGLKRSRYLSAAQHEHVR